MKKKTFEFVGVSSGVVEPRSTGVYISLLGVLVEVSESDDIVFTNDNGEYMAILYARGMTSIWPLTKTSQGDSVIGAGRLYTGGGYVEFLTKAARKATLKMFVRHSGGGGSIRVENADCADIGWANWREAAEDGQEPQIESEPT